MRIRNIFVASLLTMTFGCPGDDSGDTDANTTVVTTDNTPGTTTEDPTVDPPTTNTDGETSTTTGEPPTDDTSSSGEPPGGTDSSSSGADSGSSSGGMVNEACENFCSVYFAACGGEGANDYGDEASCATACGDFDQRTFDCKDYHASMAGSDTIHCSHANLDGGGVCPMS